MERDPSIAIAIPIAIAFRLRGPVADAVTASDPCCCSLSRSLPLILNQTL